MIKYLISVFLLLSLASILSADDEKENAFIVLPDKKEIRFPVELLASEKMLEVLACTENGPTHETVFLMDPIGVKLHEALKSFGLNSAMEWQAPIKEGFQLSMGDKVLIQFSSPEYESGKAVFIEDLLVYVPSQIPMMLRGWSFKGDQITEHGKSSPVADAEISLVNKGRNTSPMTLLLNPTNLIESYESEYGVGKKVVPFLKNLNEADKVKGELIITPVSETQIAEMNLKRYDGSNQLLLDALECAKKIDALKSVYHDKLQKELTNIILAASAEGVDEAKKKELVLQYQKSAKLCEMNLYQISYLHHLKIYKEYLFVLNRLRQEAKTKEEQNAFRFFGVHIAGLAGYLQKEKEYLYLQKIAENEMLLSEKPTAELKNKISMYVMLQKEQVVSFNVDLVDFSLSSENKRLQDDDVKNNELVKKTFLESIARNELEKKYNQDLKNMYALCASAYKNLHEVVDAKASVVEAKKGVLTTADSKNKILIHVLTKRKILLEDYLKESRDKEDKEHYKTKIKETSDAIVKSELLAKELESSLASIATDVDSLDAFLVKYEDAIRLD